MLKTTFILISKRKLTHDVYELVYSCSDLAKETPKPGQYVMFQLSPGFNRSYSLASFTPTSFTLIIKRVVEGKGSSIICDAEIGTIFSGMLPLGHFVLRDTPVAKCFIGTGTGFAPLYCQMLTCAERIQLPLDKGFEFTTFRGGVIPKEGWGDFSHKIAFIFGVRNLVDSFYADEIARLGEQIADFQYIPYLSREDKVGFQKGYVIDWITAENIVNYDEFYLCGSPIMVKSAREKLDTLGVGLDRIFWEQF